MIRKIILNKRQLNEHNLMSTLCYARVLITFLLFNDILFTPQRCGKTRRLHASEDRLSDAYDALSCFAVESEHLVKIDFDDGDILIHIRFGS